MGCRQCAGALVSLLYYRDWLDCHPEFDSADASDAVDIPADVGDSHAALRCPKCTRIMTKYWIDGAHRNRLDLCATCDEAWLDAGEWQLLRALRGGRTLSSVFTASWQHRVSREDAARLRWKRLDALLGTETLGEVERIREWLWGHPERDAVLALIASKPQLRKD
jgi:Zn-finger nucleic acid-binding protein